MVIVGAGNSKEKTLSSLLSCPHCQAKHSIEITYSQQYFHLFWIPTFPITKHYSLTCSKCHSHFTEKEIPIPLDIKKGIKTPKWTFVGLVPILAFFGYIGYTIESERKENLADMLLKIESPSVGQVYEIKIDDAKFSLLKIASVSTDSIYYFSHGYLSSLQSGLKELKVEDFLEEEQTYSLAKKDLLSLVENETILKIR